MKDFKWYPEYSYIFISYSHIDKESIQPFLQTLYDCNINFWYDKNIKVASHWSEELATRIENSSAFIAFGTENYFNSKICKDELLYAIGNFPEKQIVMISGSEQEVPDIYRLPITNTEGFSRILEESKGAKSCVLPQNIVAEELSINEIHVEETHKMNKKARAEVKRQRREIKKLEKLKKEKKNKIKKGVILASIVGAAIAISAALIIYNSGQERLSKLPERAGKTYAGENATVETVESMYEEALETILKNPVIGDMVAQGISRMKWPDGETMGDLNPWLKEFLNKTEEARALPIDVHPRGIEIWVRYDEKDEKTYVTREYLKYATGIIQVLDNFDRTVGTISGIRWAHNLATRDSDVRTYEKGPVEDQEALILQLKSENGNEYFKIGFSIYDRSLIIPPEYLTEE